MKKKNKKLGAFMPIVRDNEKRKNLISQIMLLENDTNAIQHVLEKSLKAIDTNQNRTKVIETLIKLKVSANHKKSLLKFTRKLIKQNPADDLEELIKEKSEKDFHPRLNLYLRQHKKFHPIDFIDEELKSLEEDSIEDLSKPLLVWKGKVAHLGYLFSELVEKGYIQKPKSFEEHARILYKFFEIEKGKSTGNLAKELANSSLGGKADFKIPQLKDIM